MRELVYISGNAPRANWTHVHGLWQRQQLFIEALGPMFDRVHCVFWKDLGPGEFEDDAEVQARFEDAFGRDVRVSVVRAAPRAAHRGYVDYYARSIFLGPSDQGHRRVIGPQQTAQLEHSIPASASAIFAQGLEVMSSVARLRCPLPPVLWDMNDLETLKYVRELRITPWSKGKPLRYLQTLGLLAEERRAARAADLGFVCSDIDQHRAANFLGGEFRTAPNAVEVPETPMPLDGGPPSVLFVGFFGYDPNRDAADWFIDDIWPRILEQMPEARLRIAGSRHERLRAHGKELRNVELLGFVPDLIAEYARSHVFVCPIRSGSGTRVKLLEAAAYARPIVSTRLGAEGIDFEHGESAMVVDSVDDFARSCLELLADRARAARLGSNAWELVRRCYARSSVIERIRADVDAVLANSPKRGNGTRHD
jgi:glycosyltransferase involved in cell wall biosynthesis